MEKKQKKTIRTIVIIVVIVSLIISGIFLTYIVLNRSLGGGYYGSNLNSRPIYRSPVCHTETIYIDEIKEIPYEYSVSNIQRHESGIINNYVFLSVRVTNLDDQGGNFQVKFKISFGDGGIEEWYSPAKFIGVGRSEPFGSIRYKNRNPTATVEVIAPMRTKIIKVPKENTVCE